MRGEEPTRAQIAREMVLSGDFIVPREQGEPFLSRPPLQNWLIALSCEALGRWDAAAVRLPSVFATLLTVVVTYWYARGFLSSTGSFAAAVSFATMGEMFQTGRLAETEAVFILLVSSSLLVWHGGLTRGWPQWLVWCAGYGLMALAALAKGPQAPVYFLASVWSYLFFTRQSSRLFTRAHLGGIVLALLIVGAWTLLFASRTGTGAVHDIWFGDSSSRFRGWKLTEVALHLLSYPLEVLGCTLPWSPLVLCYLRREARGKSGRVRPQILFTTLCLAIALPTCWLPPGGATRYVAPMYPCLAALIGAVVERWRQADASTVRLQARQWFFGSVAAVMVVAAAGALVLAAPGGSCFGRLAQPAELAVPYAAASVGFAVVTWKCRQPFNPRLGLGLAAVGGFMALTFVGPAMDVRIRRGEDTAGAVARLKRRLPAGQRLVSFGHVDSLFAYYFGEPISPSRQVRGLPGSAGDLDFFSFNSAGSGRPALPFAWEEVAVVSVDRNHQEPPEVVVVVGRRLPAAPPSGVPIGPLVASAESLEETSTLP